MIIALDNQDGIYEAAIVSGRSKTERTLRSCNIIYEAFSPEQVDLKLTTKNKKAGICRLLS